MRDGRCQQYTNRCAQCYSIVVFHKDIALQILYFLLCKIVSAMYVYIQWHDFLFNSHHTRQWYSRLLSTVNQQILASFPGLHHLQFLNACSAAKKLDRLQYCKRSKTEGGEGHCMQVITNWK